VFWRTGVPVQLQLQKTRKITNFLFFSEKTRASSCAQRVGKIMIDAGVATWNGKERTWHAKGKKLGETGVIWDKFLKKFSTFFVQI
jgi:hypothetical protein